MLLQSKCEPVLERFNFKWPPVLDCSRLPDGDRDRSQLCIDPPAASDELDDAFGHAPAANSFQLRQLLDALRSGPNSSSWRHHDVIGGTSPAPRGVSAVMTSRGSVCSSQRYVMMDGGSSSSSSSCRPRCGVDVLYSSDDKRSVYFFLMAFAHVQYCKMKHNKTTINDLCCCMCANACNRMQVLCKCVAPRSAPL